MTTESNKPVPARHPIQPLETDDRGVLRFKGNAIVRHLLDHGGLDMNKLACIEFTREDREQFAQLIGYSLSGFGELSYVTDEVYNAAEAMHEQGLSETQARIDDLELRLHELKVELREPIARLYGKHPDDLMSEEE